MLHRNEKPIQHIVIMIYYLHRIDNHRERENFKKIRTKVNFNASDSIARSLTAPMTMRFYAVAG